MNDNFSKPVAVPKKSFPRDVHTTVLRLHLVFLFDFLLVLVTILVRDGFQQGLVLVRQGLGRRGIGSLPRGTTTTATGSHTMCQPKEMIRQKFGIDDMGWGNHGLPKGSMIQTKLVLVRDQNGFGDDPCKE